MRYIFKFSYDGIKLFWLPKTKDKISVQEIIENAFYQIFKREVPIVASGRTDAGVSAIEQTAHFDIDEHIDSKRIVGYINSILPKDIRANSIEEADDGFHARYLAKQKTYEYLFYTGVDVIPVFDRIASHIGYNIDISAMIEACEFFIGEHDFTSFCASNTSIKDKVRTIYDMGITSISDRLYKLTVTGNGFLYNMVRIIMGTLCDVGMGKIQSSDIKDIILCKDRSKAGKTAEAKGLYLKNVRY